MRKLTFLAFFLVVSCAENTFQNRTETNQGQTLYEPRKVTHEGLTAFSVKGYSLLPLKDLTAQTQNETCFFLEVQGNHDRTTAHLDQWKIELFEGSIPETWNPLLQDLKGKEVAWKTPVDPELTPPRGEMRPDYRGKSAYWSNQGIACIQGPLDLTKGVTLRVKPSKAGTFEMSEFDLIWLPRTESQEVKTMAAGVEKSEEAAPLEVQPTPPESSDHSTRKLKRKQPYRDW